MFCSVQQDQHTSTEPRSRCQVVAHCSLRSQIRNLHIKFCSLKEVCTINMKEVLQGPLMNKAQCNDYIYTSEFYRWISQFIRFCLCYCNLRSFTIVCSSVVAIVLGCFAPAVIVLAVLGDVVNQDLMLVSRQRVLELQAAVFTRVHGPRSAALDCVVWLRITVPATKPGQTLQPGRTSADCRA